ncbi:hypothetical protein PK34_21440 [Stutzerimonas stutzeri]|nr:hypothetical protein PK34_21440 [Stutzerimonas stutzeri]
MPLLSWCNRDADLTRAALAPYRLLEPVAEMSYGEPDSPNMLIEGDNLDALKALLPYCGFHAIRPPSPLSSGQAFHGHLATCSTAIRPGSRSAATQGGHC